MIKKKWTSLYLAITLVTATPTVSFADTSTDTTTMESCGTYLPEWRPVDCGNGYYFVILVGGGSIAEGNVIPNRGYDFVYTFEPMKYPRLWGKIPTLSNVDGVWATPENQPMFPKDFQPTFQIVLFTNNNKFPDKERCIDVVKLPNSVTVSSLLPEVKKYLINADGTDAGTYEGTETFGQVQAEDGRFKYREPDGTFVSNGWLSVEDRLYYMDENGYMLADTFTPDGSYANTSDIKQKYTPGWFQNERGRKYVLKNGRFAASTWVQNTDGKYYYFDLGGCMKANYDTPDGYRIGPDGVWDGQVTTYIEDIRELGPGAQPQIENTEQSLASENIITKSL